MQTNYTDYTVNDLLLDPIKSPERTYYEIPKEQRNMNLYWGQRKLLLALIAFINIFWDPVKVSNPKFVYAGAAPGNNIEIISQLYPEIEFHLYYPSRFNIKPTDKIKIYNTYFTDEVAQSWSNRNDVYFISDVRTVEITKDTDLDVHEAIIVDNMNMQMRWYNIIKPVYAQLKFRLPFTGGNRPKKLNYLYGYIFKQPWAPEQSIETRLVPLPNGGNIEWDTEKYQNQMFYHNTVIRPSAKYYNPFNHTANHIDGNELLNDWDSTAEAVIIAAYLKKRAGKYTEDQVKAISRLFTDKLTAHHKYKENLEYKRAKR